MKKILAIVLALVMVLTMSSAAFASDAPTIIKYSVTFPNSGVQAEGAEKLAELIDQYSDGRLKLEIYYSSQLGGNTEAMEGLRMGTIEMTELSLTAISAYSDIWSTFSLPYLWDSSEQAVDVISSDAVMDVLEADVEANGMRIVSWMDMGSRSILNTKNAINEPADMKGMRIRVIEDPVLVDSITAMGGAAVAMAWSECYSGLEQGTIDGIENNTPVIVANAMQEVGKYLSLTQQFIMPDPILISDTWFQSLSEEDQKALTDACDEFTRVFNEEIWPDAEEEALQTIKDAGVEVNEVDMSVFEEATQSVRDDFVANGSDGQVELYNLLMEVKEG